MKNTHYILILAGSYDPFAEVVYDIFNDLSNQNDVNLIKGSYKDIPKILQPLWRFWTSKKINSKIRLPFISFWNHWLSFTNLKFYQDEEYYFIIQNNALTKRFDLKQLLKISELDNCRLIYYTFDPIEDRQSNMDIVRKIKFEKYITYSKLDAEKFGWEFYQTPYSTIYPELVNNKKQKIKYKIIFAGANPKSRIDFLNELFYKMENKQEDIFFNLVDINNENPKEMSSKQVQQWNQNKFIPYKDLLKKTISSNVILEIASSSMHDSPSLRYYEAIVYNKKLLTNVESIKNYPFYNPDSMKIFKTIDDIDENILNWIDKEEEIDYGYDGRFSPRNFLEFVSKK
jgi:hypothetical protein